MLYFEPLDLIHAIITACCCHFKQHLPTPTSSRQILLSMSMDFFKFMYSLVSFHGCCDQMDSQKQLKTKELIFCLHFRETQSILSEVTMWPGNDGWSHCIHSQQVKNGQDVGSRIKLQRLDFSSEPPSPRF